MMASQDVEAAVPEQQQAEQQQAQAAAPEQAEGQPQQPLSKKAQKKLKKLEIMQQKKKERKERERAEKAAAAEQRKAAAQAAAASMSAEELQAKREARHARTEAQRAEKTERRARQAAAMRPPGEGGGQRIIVDCEFEDKMLEQEVKSLCAQLRYCYAANQRTEVPAHLIVTGLQGNMQAVFARACTGQENWLVTKSAGSYLELGAEVLPGGTADLVYLTADSEAELTELDPGKAYIVGGIVDRNRHKGICLAKAQAQGIATARLPIGQYMQLSSSRVLTTNHVVEIMLKWLQLRDWGAAFEAVVPTRKRKQGGEGEGAPAGKRGGAADGGEAAAGGKQQEQQTEEQQERQEQQQAGDQEQQEAAA